MDYSTNNQPCRSKHGKLLAQWLHSGKKFREDPDDKSAIEESALEAMHIRIRDFSTAAHYQIYGIAKYNYEVRDVPLHEAIRSHQQEVDFDSYIYTAKQIKAGSFEKIHRKHDLQPILLGWDGSVLDGNHRHAAAIANGEKTIPALVPVCIGTGLVINETEYAQS